MPSLVQHSSGSAASAASCTVTLGSATTAGNCLIACISTPVNDATVSSINLGGSAGNWQAALSQASGTYSTAYIWYDPGCAGGQTSVAVTLSGTDWPQVDVYEVSGLGTAPQVDVTVIGHANGTSAAWSSGATGTSTAAAEFIAGMVSGFNNGGTSPSITGPASPWANETTLHAATGLFQLSGYQITSAEAAFTYSGTSNMTGTNNYYTAMVAAFKAASTHTAAASQTVTPAQTAAGAAQPSASQVVTPSQSAAGTAVRPGAAAQALTPSQSAAATGGVAAVYASTYAAVYGGSGDAAAAQVIAPAQAATASAVAVILDEGGGPLLDESARNIYDESRAATFAAAAQALSPPQAAVAHAVRARAATQMVTPQQSAGTQTAFPAAASQPILAAQSAAFTVTEPAPATQPAVPDFIAGYAPQTADFNAWIQAPFQWLTGKVIFRAELSAATTWIQGANTLIPFNVIDEDTYSGWNAAAHTWTPPADGTGTYEVSVTVSAAAASDATTALRCGLYLNGSALYTMSSTQASQSQDCLTGGSAPLQLYGGQDTISAYAYWNTTSGNGSAVTTAGQRATIEITWLSL